MPHAIDTSSRAQGSSLNLPYESSIYDNTPLTGVSSLLLKRPCTLQPSTALPHHAADPEVRVRWQRAIENAVTTLGLDYLNPSSSDSDTRQLDPRETGRESSLSARHSTEIGGKQICDVWTRCMLAVQHRKSLRHRMRKSPEKYSRSWTDISSDEDSSGNSLHIPDVCGNSSIYSNEDGTSDNCTRDNRDVNSDGSADLPMKFLEESSEETKTGSTGTRNPENETFETLVLDQHDHEELQHLEEQREHPEPNILQTLLSRRADLDLTGKVYDIGTAQQGHGGYSDIFIGHCEREDGVEVKVAVKKLRVHIMDDGKFQKQLAKELYIWSKLDHPRILRLEGFYIENNNYPYLVSMWMENGTILRFLKDKPDLDLMPLIIGVAEGISYLHASKIVHSDIKPDNILISESGEPFLCDFGIARMLEASRTINFNNSSHSLHGTCRFMAKELFDLTESQSSTYTKESDVWAFGMSILTLLTKEPPYSNIKSDAQIITAISKGHLPSRPADIESWPVMNILIWHVCTLCWHSPPCRRPTMQSILTKLNSIRDLCRRSDFIEFVMHDRSSSRVEQSIRHAADFGLSLEEEYDSPVPSIAIQRSTDSLDRYNSNRLLAHSQNRSRLSYVPPADSLYPESAAYPDTTPHSLSQNGPGGHFGWPGQQYASSTYQPVAWNAYQPTSNAPPASSYYPYLVTSSTPLYYVRYSD